MMAYLFNNGVTPDIDNNYYFNAGYTLRVTIQVVRVSIISNPISKFYVIKLPLNTNIVLFL